MQGTKPENPENVACRLPIDRTHFYYGDKGAIKSDKLEALRIASSSGPLVMGL